MITLPNGKICMNEQEAIQWLLDNYPIPFQCSANYAADTEIGLGTIVNPTPAKVKVGSLIFFADSKVSTVVGLTANGFICSDQYNDLVDDVVYVSNVAINASGHLIVTLSNATTIDAGLIKQVSSFSINASQHLIVSYNDGTTTDLGAIFSGNITVSGNLTVTGGISGNAITGNSIVENMTGYNMFKSGESAGFTYDYMGVCKNGNKLTCVLSGSFTPTASTPSSVTISNIYVPQAVADQLVNNGLGALEYNVMRFYKDLSTSVEKTLSIKKNSDNSIGIQLYGAQSGFTLNETYYYRIEFTVLMSHNFAS